MSQRQLLEVRLRPIAGSRFQPTGFPDIGAATFRRPTDDAGEWEDCLLVESTQSMANHLEAVGWDRGEQRPVAALDGLPYVRVVDGAGGYLSSSRTEAHRLAGAFVKDAELDGRSMKDVIRERLGLRDDTPLAPRQIAAGVFSLDPLCLVHGVFFAEKANVWPGQPKVARALTAFVEAHGVEQVVSGGVKRDEVRHTIGEGEGGAAEGYGSIPFHRTEWVARDIIASFCIDLDQLASYGLPKPATELLTAVARYEVRSLLDRGFRPRTACDLAICDPAAVDEELGSVPDLVAEIRDLLPQCAELLGSRGPLDVVWTQGKKRTTRA